MARAGVDRIERDFEHQALLDLAHRPEALDRVAADPAVEPFQFLVGEAEIGLADRKQLALLAPAAERVVAVVARAFARAALGIHQHAIGGQRIALPLVPQAGAAPGDIGAVAALEHDPFDRDVARVEPQVLELLEALRLDQLRDVEPLAGRATRRSSRAARGARSHGSSRRSSSPRTRCRRAGRTPDRRRASSG